MRQVAQAKWGGLLAPLALLRLDALVTTGLRTTPNGILPALITSASERSLVTNLAGSGTVLANTGTVDGVSGDSGQATSAHLNVPHSFPGT